MHENARFCSPFVPQIVSGNFAKHPFITFFHFWMTTLKNTYFYAFLGLFHFFFSFFLFLCLQHKKDKKKMLFSFRKPHFWYPHNFAKTLFWHNVTLLVFWSMPKNTITFGKAVKKLGPVEKPNSWTSFDTKAPKSWTSFYATLQHAHIYIYIWLWARLPPQILLFLAFFSPVLQQKVAKKRCFKFAPSLYLRFWQK